MALIKDSLGKNSLGVQRLAVASGRATQEALGAASDEVVMFDLPAGTVITALYSVVTEVFDGTTPLLGVSTYNMDGTLAAAGVLDAAVDGATLGITVAPVTADPTTAPIYVTVRNTVADSTEGVAEVYIEYFVEGRSDENTG